jgi:threonine/homoserine/homoserine lactone efflux protein
VLTWRICSAEPATSSRVAPPAPGLAATLGGAVAPTLSNPATIVSFIAIFGTLVGAVRTCRRMSWWPACWPARRNSG